MASYLIFLSFCSACILAGIISGIWNLTTGIKDGLNNQAIAGGVMCALVVPVVILTVYGFVWVLG